jgi:hypothetical protein
MTAPELETHLANFYGTEGYHRLVPFVPNLVFTDGAKALAVGGGAFWLMEAIASHQNRAMRDESLRGFQFWKLRVNDDRSAVLTCERDEGDVAITQEIPATDFPLKEAKVWVVSGGEGPDGEAFMVGMLPSEY